LFDSFAFQRRRRKIPRQQEKRGHKVRLVDDVEEAQQNGADLIRHRVSADIPGPTPAIGQRSVMKNYQKSQVNSEIIQKI